MFYNTIYLLWVAYMGTHNNEDTHTLFMSIVKYDLCPDYSWVPNISLSFRTFSMKTLINRLFKLFLHSLNLFVNHSTFFTLILKQFQFISLVSLKFRLTITIHLLEFYLFIWRRAYSSSDIFHYYYIFISLCLYWLTSEWLWDWRHEIDSSKTVRWRIVAPETFNFMRFSPINPRKIDFIPLRCEIPLATWHACVFYVN